MNILNLEKVSMTFEDRVILSDVTLGIDDSDKIGVIGINGMGKSTLLSIAAGLLEPDEGKVIRQSGIRISCLTQNPLFSPDKTCLENVLDQVYGSPDRYSNPGEARAMLAKFGIPDADALPDTLSGGQRKRAALVAAVMTPCDLLILDEPTNHLDHEMIEWMEDFLIHFRGAVLMVTHDRYFLDEVTNQILEIDRGKVYRYEENYSGFLELKQQRLDYAAAAERKMAALYKKDLAWILRGARARSTKQKAHIRRFEALRDREKPEEERQVLMSSLSSRLGGKTIELQGVSKSYNGKTLFSDFSYIFLKTDRIGIIGPNGCGKSTLTKIISGELKPDTGTVEWGQTVKIGYFGQENILPDGDVRVIDYVREAAEYIRTSDGLITASAMCERFLFDSRMQYTPLRKLSGGEKRRLYLLRILMTAPNVLILDEPTNDLDIPTLRVLEDYLDSFAGIIIAVSHDRYFLDRVVTRIFAFEDGRIARSEGGYTDYHARTAGMSRDAAAPDRLSAQDAGKDTSGSAGKGAGKEKADWKKDSREKPKTRLSFKEQREYDGIEAEIDALTEKLASLEAEITEASSDYLRLSELSAEKEETEQKLEERMERFLELQELVDSFSKGGTG